MEMEIPPSATEDMRDNTGGGFMSYIMGAVRALGGAESATIHQADLLYASCEQQALLSSAREKLDLQKTFMSEHFLVALHVWIVQRCLLRPELETSEPWVFGGFGSKEDGERKRERERETYHAHTHIHTHTHTYTHTQRVPAPWLQSFRPRQARPETRVRQGVLPRRAADDV